MVKIYSRPIVAFIICFNKINTNVFKVSRSKKNVLQILLYHKENIYYISKFINKCMKKILNSKQSTSIVSHWNSPKFCWGIFYPDFLCYQEKISPKIFRIFGKTCQNCAIFSFLKYSTQNFAFNFEEKKRFPLKFHILSYSDFPMFKFILRKLHHKNTWCFGWYLLILIMVDRTSFLLLLHRNPVPSLPALLGTLCLNISEFKYWHVA